MQFNFLVLGALAFVLGGLMGCVSTGLTSNPTPRDPLNSAVYRFNILDARSHAELLAVQEAFDLVMGDLGFVRTQRERGDDTLTLTYRGEDDLGVQVKLKSFFDYTNIRIRYRLVGDEYQSRRVLEQVIEQLGGSPRAAS